MVQDMYANLKVRGEWIRKTHVSWESRENEVPHLNAIGWNYITEREVIVTEELREIMKQHQ